MSQSIQKFATVVEPPTEPGQGQDAAVIVHHNLNTKDVVVDFFNEEGERLALSSTVMDDNTLKVYAEKAWSYQVRVVVIG